MSEHNYQLLEVAGGVPVKMWTKGVPVETEARQQLANAARLPVSSNILPPCPMCTWALVPPSAR